MGCVFLKYRAKYIKPFSSLINPKSNSWKVIGKYFSENRKGEKEIEMEGLQFSNWTPCWFIQFCFWVSKDFFRSFLRIAGMQRRKKAKKKSCQVLSLIAQIKRFIAASVCNVFWSWESFVSLSLEPKLIDGMNPVQFQIWHHLTSAGCCRWMPSKPKERSLLQMISSLASLAFKKMYLSIVQLHCCLHRLFIDLKSFVKLGCGAKGSESATNCDRFWRAASAT